MRILHFVPDIGVANGVMSVVLNYFRAMPEDIKFDVMYFKECERDRSAEIEALRRTRVQNKYARNKELCFVRA